MKKNTTALVIAMVGLVAMFVSCTKDDSMWGMEAQTYQKSAPAQPASEDVLETKATVSYVGEFEVKDVEVNTVDQNNTITTVTIKNGEEVNRTTNVVRLTLAANLANAVNVKVDSREALEATTFNFAKKANDANEVKEGDVVKRSVKDVYTTDLKDGNVLDLSTLVESAKADTLKLLNAEFKDIKVKSIESVKNEALSSETAEVNDVTVVYEGVIVKADAEDEVFELSTSYTRTMEIAPIAPVQPKPAQPAFKGFAVSAVPAMAENGKLVDGKGEREAHKAFVFFKENSAITVIVPMNAEPTAEMVANGDVWEGDFSSCNSAYYLQDGTWKPCIAQDAEDGIKYFEGNTCVRSIRKSSLENWNWRNGNFSTVVSGYSCSFEGENMIVSYNGQVVLTLK